MLSYRINVLVLGLAALSAIATAADGRRNILVNPATDRILPAIFVGGGWKTTITLVNLDTIPSTFNLGFITADGDLLSLPVTGLGRVSILNQVTVAPNASLVIETERYR